MQAQWRENLGVEVSIANMEWKVFLDKLQNDPPQMFRMGWGADYPDPDNFMNLFTSYSGNNKGRWKNARYDALYGPGPQRSYRAGFESFISWLDRL